MSACFPGTMEPRRPAARRAAAPLMVAAQSASSGVIFIWVQAAESVNCMFQHGAVPGLKSVARATGTPPAMNSLAAG